MQTYIITKEDVGRTLFAIPTGNSICRYGRPRVPQLEQVKEITIDKVARKYVTINGGHQIKLNEGNGKAYEDKHHSSYGYVFFETMEDIVKVKVVKGIASQITTKYNFCTHWEDVPHDKMVQIAEILGFDY